jgi:SAM-dependent methyltransferase
MPARRAPDRPVTRTGFYRFASVDEAELRRLDDQAALWDEFTFQRLAETGLSRGWRCLEIGGGTGTVATWLADRVGPRGHVVVTDLETRRLERLAASGLEVRRHDIVSDPIEPAGYDVVHARLVLTHLPQRDAVVRKLAAALRPGGWLVLEDQDLRTFGVTPPDHPTWTKVARAVAAVLDGAGADTGYGNELAPTLRSAGLTGIDARALTHVRPAPELASPVVPVLEQVRDAIVDAGLATDAEFEHVMALFHDETTTLSIYSPMLVSARGRAG